MSLLSALTHPLNVRHQKSAPPKASINKDITMIVDPNFRDIPVVAPSKDFNPTRPDIQERILILPTHNPNELYKLFVLA